jgi:hypothetical protein
MSKRHYIEELEHNDAKGLDTASPITLVVQGYVREAMNVNLGTTGGYSKRSGYAHQFSAGNELTGFSIRQGIEYRQSTGLTQIILSATDNSIESKIGQVILGVFTPFKDSTGTDLSLDPFVRPSFAQVGDSLFYFDGSGNVKTPFVYEAYGSYVRELGIDAPSAAPTFVVSAGGTLNEGQYLYAYTYAFYYNNQLIAESSPSEISATITTTSVNKKVTLTFVAYPNYADLNLAHLDMRIRIWRTVVNGSILFLETEVPAFTPSAVPPNTVSYPPIGDSNKSDDALLSEQMPFDNTRLQDYTDYDKARFPVVARNRLLVFHPEQNRGRYSKVGPNGPLPESFPVQNEFSVEGKFGAADAVVGAGQIKGIPIVLKERSIGRLEEVGLPDIGNSEDNVTYIYREISEVTGAVSHHAQCQVFDELLFLGRDNIYATDGQNIRPIASFIQNIIKSADFSGSKAYKISAINDTKNRRVYFQIFSNQTAAEPDLTLVGDYQQYPTFRWTTYEAGDNKITHPGINAGCFFQTEATATGGLDIYFGSATNEGQYYKMNTGDSDYYQGSEYPILMRLVTRPYYIGQPMITKLFKTAKIYAEARDNTYEFEFGAKFDLEYTEQDKTSYEVLGIGTVWAPASQTYQWTWSPSEVSAYQALQALNPLLPNAPSADPGNSPLLWTGFALQEFKFNVHRKAQMMQLVFTQDDEDAPLTLLGWGVSGSIFSGV